MTDRKHYRSHVYIGPFELKMFEQFSMTNLEHAIKSSPLVLKSVSPWLRPFCRVRWELTMTESDNALRRALATANMQRWRAKKKLNQQGAKHEQ